MKIRITSTDIKNIKCFFKKNPKQKYFACKCKKNIINSLVKVLQSYMENKKLFKVLSSSEKKKFRKFLPAIKNLVNKNVKIVEKRKILSNIGIKVVLDPLITSLSQKYIEAIV